MTRPDEYSSPRIPGDRFLHSPGPTHIPAEVLNAMHRQPMDHGDPRLDAVIASKRVRAERGMSTLAADPARNTVDARGASNRESLATTRPRD
jgi:alanine-glyoxylate transaminase/serine-glyoxylate transaminase/serine-pyruvate transaminase